MAWWSSVSEMRLVKLLAVWLIQVTDKHQSLLIFSKSHLWQLKSDESYQLGNLLHVYAWYRHLLLPLLPIFFKSLSLAVLSLHCSMGFSLVVAIGAYSALPCSDFSLRQLLVLWNAGSGVRRLSTCSSLALEDKLSRCGVQARFLQRTWDLPRSGMEPLSPALAGGLFTTGLPGKPHPFS